MNIPLAFLRRRLALAVLLACSSCPAAFADNDPGVVCNGPVLNEGASIPTAFDFDATPAPAPVNFASLLHVPAATGSYAKMSTTLGDIYIEFVDGAVLGSGNTTVSANTTVNRVKSYLATGTTADSSANSYDGVFFHRSVPSSANQGFAIIQSGGFKLTSDFNLVNVAAKPALKNQFLAANTRGTLAMARTSDPDSATNQWFINLTDNSEVFGTANTGGYVVFARILGDGIKVADAIAALPTYDVDGSGSTFNETPLYKYKAGSNLSLTNFIFAKTFREVPAASVPSTIRTPIITYSIVGNTNPAAVTATLATTGTLTLKPTTRGGRSQITVRAQVPSGHYVDSVITTTKLGPPVVVKAPATTASGALGYIATLNADVTAWPFYIKWQRRANASAEWQDLVESTEEAPTLFVDTTTKALKIYLYGETTEEAAASLALSGSQFRYVVSNNADFTGTPLQGAPITFTVTTALAFKDLLAKSTTAALGSTVTLTARATDGTLPLPTYQWQRLAPGGTTWENLANAAAAVEASDGPPPVEAQAAVLSPYSGVTSANLTIRLNGTTPATGTGISTAATLALNKSQYRCVITHNRGAGALSANSAATTLNITTLPVAFSAQPPALFGALLGGNATVSVTAAAVAANTPLTYQWQRLPAGQDPKVSANWSNLSNDARYSGVGTRTLTVALTATDDGAKAATLSLSDDQYRCVITNVLGAATSTPSKLVVVVNELTLVTAVNGVALPGLTAQAQRTFVATGMPAGIVLNSTTGQISGTPTKSALYRVVVTTYDNGVAAGTRTYYFNVVGLSGNNLGGFEALLRPADDSAPPVAKLALLVTSTGAYTGTLTTAEDAKPLPLTGVVVRSTDGALAISSNITLVRAGTPSGRSYILSGVGMSANGTLSATLFTRASAAASPVLAGNTTTGVKLIDAGGSAAWASMGVFNLALTKPDNSLSDDAVYPRGSGYGRASIDTAGKLSITGKLGDGALFTASVSTGTDASYRLFARPYGTLNGSYLISDFKFASTSVYNPNTGGTFNRYAVEGNAGMETYWGRPGGVTKPASYFAGFGPLGLTLQVQPWIFFNGTNLGLKFNDAGTVATIGLALNGALLDNTGGNARGLPTTLSLNLNTLALTDAAPPDNSQLSIQINGSTGVCSGSLLITDAGVTRVVALEGVFLVPTNTDNSELDAGTVTFEGIAIIPAASGSTAGFTTERIRLHQPGAAPTTP